uniref:DUF913 domain-containing protein n=1 Tax=Nelumbo nucifera TaxID=4432 RepID=A0A822ZQJ2_NELNU|nr:TPA_asm: hypothetical protein HUJ06_003426 [Nelumbo nucifera]
MDLEFIIREKMRREVSLADQIRAAKSKRVECVAVTNSLVHVISSSSSGNSIRGSGMVPTLLPLLQDVNVTHMHLVCCSVKTLQKLMDYSNAAVSLFKDLGGVELLSQRLETEVHRVIGLSGADDNSMVSCDLSRYDDDQLYSQKRLIKALLKALGSATYAPGSCWTNPIHDWNASSLGPGCT